MQTRSATSRFSEPFLARAVRLYELFDRTVLLRSGGASMPSSVRTSSSLLHPRLKLWWKIAPSSNSSGSPRRSRRLTTEAGLNQSRDGAMELEAAVLQNTDGAGHTRLRSVFASHCTENHADDWMKKTSASACAAREGVMRGSAAEYHHTAKRGVEPEVYLDIRAGIRLSWASLWRPWGAHDTWMQPR